MSIAYYVLHMQTYKHTYRLTERHNRTKQIMEFNYCNRIPYIHMYTTEYTYIQTESNKNN